MSAIETAGFYLLLITLAGCAVPLAMGAIDLYRRLTK